MALRLKTITILGYDQLVDFFGARTRQHLLRVQSDDVELGSPLCPLDLFRSQGPDFVRLVVNVRRGVVRAVNSGYDDSPAEQRYERKAIVAPQAVDSECANPHTKSQDHP